MTTKQEISAFTGFEMEYKKNFWKIPTMLESYMCSLTGAEFKVLIFILRNTFGFNKLEDYISLSQFVSGNTKSNKGTGLSTSQVRRALASLESKGFIIVEKQFHKTSLIKLRLKKIEINNEIDSNVFVNEDIIRLIMLFKNICPHKVEKYLTNRRQIQSMENLVKTYGIEKVENAILILPKVMETPYCPRISSPSSLEDKFTDLYYFIQQKAQERKSKQVIFSF
jgi:hypothetical protein